MDILTDEGTARGPMELLDCCIFGFLKNYLKKLACLPHVDMHHLIACLYKCFLHDFVVNVTFVLMLNM